jgi:transcriptional regulator of heat shock response
VTVRIGGENEAEEMRDTSVVSIGYGTSTVLGGMGVVGPPGWTIRVDRGGACRRSVRR